MRKYILFHMHVLLSFAFGFIFASTGAFLCFAPDFISFSFADISLQDLSDAPHSPSFAMPLLQAFSLRYVPFFPHFAGALPITMTAALLRSFAMPLLRAFSLLHAPFLLSAFAGAFPITMTAALLRSFAMPLLRAFSLFCAWLQLFILCRHSAARPVIHAALPVFCHASRAGILSCACALPVFRRGVTTFLLRSARI